MEIMTSTNVSASSGDQPDPTVARRRVLAGVAWTVPVIATAVATPFAAASGCVSGSIDYSSGYTRTSVTQGAGTGTSTSGQNFSYSLTAAYGSRITPPSDNLTIYDPGSGPSQLNVLANASAEGTTSTQPDARYTVTLTYSFSEPVENVEFTLWDVDSNLASGTPSTGGAFYTEWVRVTAPGVVATRGSGLSVNSAGWVYPTNWGNQGATDPNYAVTYRIPGPVQSFTIEMSRPNNNTAINAGGGIGLSGVQLDFNC